MKKQNFKCATCRKNLEEGMDLLELHEAIVGMHSIVPLNSPYYFCSIECLKGYFNGAKETVYMKRKVP